MNNEWFEVAYINHDEAILHGQIAEGRSERELRIVLSDEQRQQIVDMNERHREEMQALLRGMAS